MESLLKTKKDKKQFLKWIEALRSGKYEQDTTVLQSNKGYCCLGVGCEVLIPEAKQERRDGLLSGCLPSDQSYAPDWLIYISSHLSLSGVSLLWMNDSAGLNFNEIADNLMEAYKEELEAIK